MDMTLLNISVFSVLVFYLTLVNIINIGLVCEVYGGFSWSLINRKNPYKYLFCYKWMAGLEYIIKFCFIPNRRSRMIPHSSRQYGQVMVDGHLQQLQDWLQELLALGWAQLQAGTRILCHPPPWEFGLSLELRMDRLGPWQLSELLASPPTKEVCKK